MRPNQLTHRGLNAALAALIALALLGGLFAPARPAFAANPTELFFSEYIEGSSNNKALEIYNGTGSSVNLATGGYNVQMFFNGSASAGLTINLTGTVASGDVFVLAQTSANATILAQADLTNNSGWFNGDDAVVLRKGTTVIDSLGQIGVDPGAEWGSGLVSTADNTLRRKASVCAGDTNGANVFDPATEWDGFANDTFDGLGSHSTSCAPTTPTVSISATDDSAGEGGNAGSFRITRSGSTAAALTVSYSLAGTAAAGDYSPALGGSATILTGQSFVDISILPEDDSAFEGSETLTINLIDGADYDLGSPASATVTIADNDVQDAAPAVAGTVPANGATNVSVSTNISVTFSEPVNVSAGQITLECPAGTPISFSATGASNITSLVIDPSANLPFNTTCTLTIPAGAVSDVDGNDPPDTMVATFNTGFTTAADPCTQTFTPIYSIQGSGNSAAITGSVTTQGVVVGDFDGPTSSGLQGFYIQDPSGDGNAATSDGIFVYTGDATLVSAGQLVRVTGFARERFNQTTINGTNSNGSAVPAANILVCGSGSVAPVDVTLPFASATAPERYEGMLVRFPQALQITEYFNFDQFGELVLGLPLPGEPRLFSPTSIEEPGAPAIARAAANSLRRITLDDARGNQNPDPARHPNGAPFSLSNTFRGGDQVQNAVGVLGFDFSLYRIQPTGPASYIQQNPRPAAPKEVGGSLKISAFNTLNYFLTLDPLDDSSNNDNPLDNICGPATNKHDCRGADLSQPLEFGRQRAKLLAAVQGLNADVLGLNELENTVGVEPLLDIVNGLNDAMGAGSYAYIDTGTIGTDAIKVGIIYKPGKVTPVGAYQILDSSVDPRFLDTKSRPVLAQTFEENATGARFTVAVGHLKSKGSACNDVGDPDAGDGSGNCNGTRTKAAQAIVDWLASDPTGSGDPDYLIVGDLNSYAKEDPIDAILAGADDTPGTGDDYTNLILQYEGPFAYSYVFDGQFGYLDHALASASMAPQVTGATEWHINADESDLLDYDTSFKQPAQEAIYEENAYRTSDHDPVQVGLKLNVAPVASAGGPYSVAEGGSVTLSASATDSTYADSLEYAWDLDNDGSFETDGQSVSFSAADLDGPTTATVSVRVTDGLGLSDTDSVTIDVTNEAPTVSASFASGSVACSVASTLSGTISDPGVADTFSAVVDWGDGSAPESVTVTDRAFSASHTYALAGKYTATVTVTDDDGGSGAAEATTAVRFTVVGGGVLPPINQDGSSVFKHGRTIPVKVMLRDCDGSFPADLAPTIRYQLISGATPGPINEPESSSGADSGGVMRFDPSNNQYIYNLDSRSFPDPTASYRLLITVPSSGQVITVDVRVRP